MTCGSADIEGPYRYLLSRWAALYEGEPPVLFVMLNPSTADEQSDDPTIRRCLDFTRRWGFWRLEVVNLYAFRATDPTALLTARDPVGPRNPDAVRAACERAAKIVVAWGDSRSSWPEPERDRLEALVTPVGEAILTCGKPLLCLGWTANGQPRHPLYVRGDTVPCLSGLNDVGFEGQVAPPPRAPGPGISKASRCARCRHRTIEHTSVGMCAWGRCLVPDCGCMEHAE